MNTYRKNDRLKDKRFKHYWKLFLKDSYLLDSLRYRYDYSFKRPMTEKAIVDELLSYDSTLKLAYDTCQLLFYHYKQKDTNYFFVVVNTLDTHYLTNIFLNDLLELVLWSDFLPIVCSFLRYILTKRISFFNTPSDKI